MHRALWRIVGVVVMSGWYCGTATAQDQWAPRRPWTNSPGPGLGPPLRVDANYDPAYPYRFAATTVPLESGIFMTSLNYPGVYGSYYYGPGGTMTPIGPSPAAIDRAAIKRPARIDLRVPAQADVWFNGLKMTDEGSWRSITSPPLGPGREHVYDIVVRWFEKGREIRQDRTVRVAAGERVYLDFTAPLESATLRPRTELPR